MSKLPTSITVSFTMVFACCLRSLVWPPDKSKEGGDEKLKDSGDDKSIKSKASAESLDPVADAGDGSKESANNRQLTDEENDFEVIEGAETST